MIEEQEFLLIYDGDCPFCTHFSKLVRINESIGELKLINARDNSAVKSEITSRGMDIDHGMVLKMQQQFYVGAEALHMLALLSSRSSLFNRINYQLFKSRRLAGWLYPLLRLFRNLLLKLLGKRKINNLNIPGNERF